MSIRRKRSDLALGPARALGVQGVRVIEAQSASSSTVNDPVASYTAARAGDLILALAFSGNAITTQAVTSPGLTFTEVSSALHQGLTVVTARAWSPDATARSVTFESDASASTAVVVMVLRGVDPISPIDVTPAHTAHNAASSFTVPSIDTQTARALAVLVAGSNDDNTLTAPGPWTAQRVLNISTARAFGVWTSAVAAAGAIGTTVVTETVNGPDTAHSAVFAVRALAG